MQRASDDVKDPIEFTLAESVKNLFQKLLQARHQKYQCDH